MLNVENAEYPSGECQCKMLQVMLLRQIKAWRLKMWFKKFANGRAKIIMQKQYSPTSETWADAGLINTQQFNQYKNVCTKTNCKHIEIETRNQYKRAQMFALPDIRCLRICKVDIDFCFVISFFFLFFFFFFNSFSLFFISVNFVLLNQIVSFSFFQTKLLFNMLRSSIKRKCLVWTYVL